MDVVYVSRIVDDRITAVWNFLGNPCLSLLDNRKYFSFRVIILERRELNEKIRKIPLSPFTSPAADKSDGLIEIRRAVSAVRAPLIPDRSFNRVRHQPRNHPVPEHGRHILAAFPRFKILQQPKIVFVGGRPRFNARAAP